jgi:hypothetical protein
MWRGFARLEAHGEVEGEQRRAFDAFVAHA